MRYIVKESEAPGWWVATDTEYLIVIRFQEHLFNETQEVTLLENSSLTASEAARVMREFGDYMVKNHLDIIH